jgi:SAM domain (Sterile alpha motif)
MDLAEWLRGVGIEKYMPAFRANDIDGEVLRRLTGEDLRELGVNSIGHRRRLLDGIAALSTAEAPAPQQLRRREVREAVSRNGRAAPHNTDVLRRFCLE